MNTKKLEEALSGITPIVIKSSELEPKNFDIITTDQDEDESDIDLKATLAQYGLTKSDVINVAFESEFIISRIFARVLKNSYCKNLSNNEWMKFNNSTWNSDIKNEHLEFSDYHIRRNIVASVLSIFHAESKSSTKKALSSLNDKLSKNTEVKNLCELACSGADGIGVPGEHFDIHREFIGAPNGIINLQNGNLLQNDPKYYITKSVGFKYNANAEEPTKFINFLKEVFLYISPKPELVLKELSDLTYYNESETSNDIEFEIYNKEKSHNLEIESLNNKAIEDYEIVLQKYKEQCSENLTQIISFIQRLLGYIITGECNEHIFVVLHGAEGRNGKGVLVRTIMAILGDYGGEVRPERGCTGFCVNGHF